MLIQPEIFKNIKGIIAAQSTRHGGVSAAPYQSLNLGKNTNDDPARVQENRRLFGAALRFAPAQMAWSYQVHGLEVRHAQQSGGSEGFDALITNTPGIVLAVSVADCTPVLVYDQRHGAMAAIHAGWKGASGQIVRKTLEAMENAFGTRGEDCLAFIGACIDAAHFEVGPEVAAAFDPVFVFDPNDGRGKYFVDLKNACAAQLQSFGLAANQIEISPFSTITDNENFFSHRHEKGITGRMLAVIGKSENSV